jgi:hypothetical protein
LYVDEDKRTTIRLRRKGTRRKMKLSKTWERRKRENKRTKQKGKNVKGFT